MTENQARLISVELRRLAHARLDTHGALADLPAGGWRLGPDNGPIEAEDQAWRLSSSRVFLATRFGPGSPDGSLPVHVSCTYTLDEDNDSVLFNDIGVADILLTHPAISEEWLYLFTGGEPVVGEDVLQGGGLGSMTENQERLIEGVLRFTAYTTLDAHEALQNLPEGEWVLERFAPIPLDVTDQAGRLSSTRVFSASRSGPGNPEGTLPIRVSCTFTLDDENNDVRFDDGSGGTGILLTHPDISQEWRELLVDGVARTGFTAQDEEEDLTTEPPTPEDPAATGPERQLELREGAALEDLMRQGAYMVFCGEMRVFLDVCLEQAFNHEPHAIQHWEVGDLLGVSWRQLLGTRLRVTFTTLATPSTLEGDGHAVELSVGVDCWYERHGALRPDWTSMAVYLTLDSMTPAVREGLDIRFVHAPGDTSIQINLEFTPEARPRPTYEGEDVATDAPEPAQPELPVEEEETLRAAFDVMVLSSKVEELQGSFELPYPEQPAAVQAGSVLSANEMIDHAATFLAEQGVEILDMIQVTSINWDLEEDSGGVIVALDAPRLYAEVKVWPISRTTEVATRCHSHAVHWMAPGSTDRQIPTYGEGDQDTIEVIGRFPEGREAPPPPPMPEERAPQTAAENPPPPLEGRAPQTAAGNPPPPLEGRAIAREDVPPVPLPPRGVLIGPGGILREAPADLAAVADTEAAVGRAEPEERLIPPTGEARTTFTRHEPVEIRPRPGVDIQEELARGALNDLNGANEAGEVARAARDMMEERGQTPFVVTIPPTTFPGGEAQTMDAVDRNAIIEEAVRSVLRRFEQDGRLQLSNRIIDELAIRIAEAAERSEFLLREADRATIAEDNLTTEPAGGLVDEVQEAPALQGT